MTKHLFAPSKLQIESNGSIEMLFTPPIQCSCLHVQIFARCLENIFLLSPVNINVQLDYHLKRSMDLVTIFGTLYSKFKEHSYVIQYNVGDWVLAVYHNDRR